MGDRGRFGSMIGLVVGAACLVPMWANAATGPTSTKAILRAGVMVADDVPAGWTKGQRRNTHDRQLRGIAACKQIIAVDAAADRGVPQARSAAFSDPSSRVRNTTKAEDTVYAFKTAKAASRYLAVFQAPDVAQCLRDSVQRSLGSRVAVTLSPITDLGSLGDANVGYEIMVDGADSKGHLTLYADSIGVRVGRAVVGFNFLNLGSRLPQSTGILNTVVNRLA